MNAKSGLPWLLLLLLLLLLMQIPRSETEASNLCTSQACIAISAQLLHNLNLSADPCQDFENFACGGFQQREAFGSSVYASVADRMKKRMFELLTRPELARSEDDAELDQMYNATRDSFLACAGWYNARLEWLPNSSHSHWNSTVHPEYQSPKTLVEPIAREINKKQSTPEEYLAHLVTTGFSGVLELLYQSSSANRQLLSARSSGPVLALRALNFHFAREWNDLVSSEIVSLCSELKINLTSNVKDVVRMQNTIFNLDSSEIYEGNLKQLQQQTTRELSSELTFNWTAFVNYLQSGLAEDDLQVVVVGKSSLIKVVQLLVSDYGHNRSVLSDFLRIDAAMSVSKALSTVNFMALKSSYTNERPFILGTFEQESDIVNYCMNKTVAAMAPVTYQMFRTAYSEQYSFDRIESLIDDVKEAMRQNVAVSRWLGSRTKEFMQRKILTMQRVLVYHQFSPAELQHIYIPNGLMKKLSTDQHYGEIEIILRMARNRLILWALTSSTSSTMPWYHIAPMAMFDPFEANAYYLQPINAIFFPAGFLGSYMYHRDYPRYLQYGGIGEVIGHEVGHAFSPEHFYLDELSQLTSAIDPETNRTYVDRVGCLTRFYDKLNMTASVRVNGTQTVEENLADIVGINAAFRAYRNSLDKSQKSSQQLLQGLSTVLTPDQLFFVQAAQFNCEKLTDNETEAIYKHDGHSPGPARTFGTMSQSKEFSRVFNCRPGNKMQLPDADRCPLW